MQKVFVFLVAVITVVATTSLATAQVVEVVYNRATGEVIIGQMTSIVGLKLISTSSKPNYGFHPDIVIGTLATGIDDSTTPNNLGVIAAPGLVNSTQAFAQGFVEWGNIAGGITTAGPVSQGLLLLPGIAKHELSVEVVKGDFSAGTGDLYVLPLPEPGALALAGLGLVGLGVMRRRRAVAS